jgi:hypothetical protein
MSGNTEGTATNSTDSGQGSEPLSDVFVAVATGGRSKHDPVRMVKAPESSDRLFVRRSARMASSRSHSVQASASNPAVVEVVDALPGGKRRVGYAYEVLEAANEGPGPSIRPVVPAGNASSLRDAATPQSGPTAGRKRSATSAAPASGRRGPTPKRLASAADFSPTHFDEPASDDQVPPLLASHLPVPPSLRHHSILPPPSMHVPEVPQATASSRRTGTPISSPISRNPLLRGGPGSPMDVQTPSPRRLPFRTQDSNAAWAAAEGLLPIPEGFTAPGYVPAHVVGGITYTVRSPQTLSPRTRQPSARPASVGRQLFAEFTGVGVQGDGAQRFVPQETVLPQQNTSQPRVTSSLPQQITFQEVDLPQRSTSRGLHLQQQQATSLDVRISCDNLIHAHIY